MKSLLDYIPLLLISVVCIGAVVAVANNGTRTHLLAMVAAAVVIIGGTFLWTLGQGRGE